MLAHNYIFGCVRGLDEREEVRGNGGVGGGGGRVVWKPSVIHYFVGRKFTIFYLVDIPIADSFIRNTWTLARSANDLISNNHSKHRTIIIWKMIVFHGKSFTMNIIDLAATSMIAICFVKRKLSSSSWLLTVAYTWFCLRSF